MGLFPSKKAALPILDNTGLLDFGVFSWLLFASPPTEFENLFILEQKLYGTEIRCQGHIIWMRSVDCSMTRPANAAGSLH